MVLRRGADHRRPADVDVLDRDPLVDLVAGDGLLERVEVDADQVDRLDPLALEHRHVLGVVAPRQQRRVQPRVQGLHAAVEDLGLAGELGDVGDLEPRLAQGARGAAGREDLDPLRGQRPGEVGDAGLVGDRDQRPAHPDRAVAHGLGRGVCWGLSHRRRRPRAVVGVDPNCARRDHADRLRVELVLDRVDRLLQRARSRSAGPAPRAGGSAGRCRRPRRRSGRSPRSSRPRRRAPGRSRRVPGRPAAAPGGVDDAVAEAGDEGGGEQLHVAGEDDEVGAARLDPLGHRRVARVAPRVLLAREDRGLDPRRPRPLQRPRAGLVRADPDDLDPLASVQRVEDRLQIRPEPQARTTMRKPSSNGIAPDHIVSRPGNAHRAAWSGGDGLQRELAVGVVGVAERVAAPEAGVAVVLGPPPIAS